MFLGRKRIQITHTCDVQLVIQEVIAMNTELRTNLVELLRETGRAHHAAFAATDGADPDWSEYYADEFIACNGTRVANHVPESRDIVRYLETTVA